MTDSTSDSNGNATTTQAMGSANKQSSAQALVVQTFSNSVLEQPDVDLSGFTELQTFQTEINTGLNGAREHAHHYLNDIQPALIKNISNIGSYYELHQAIPTVVPAGSATKDWLDVLHALKDEATDYEASAAKMLDMLTKLHDTLSDDAKQFSHYVTEMNGAVGGDNGVLADLSRQIDDVRSKIDWAIAGAALSGVAIAGGALLTCVGGVAEFVTAGASTPLVLAGVAIMSVGFVGAAGSAAGLITLYDTKANLLKRESDLKEEVKLALGLQAGYNSLFGQVRNAVTASSNMSNAWSSLSSDLDKLIADIDKGDNPDASPGVSRLFLGAANNEIKIVLSDVDTIKQQLAGVQQIVAQPGQLITDLIRAHAA